MAAGSDAFARFGYTLTKLEQRDGSLWPCTSEPVQAGTPLLVLPLSCCWSAAAAEAECPQALQALAKAVARQPDSELLRSETTKMVLHLLWEVRQQQHSPEKTGVTEAVQRRRAHLELLKNGPRPETLLAWGRKDLDALSGSFWQEEAHRRQDEIVADLQDLLSEFGPQVAMELGLCQTADEAEGELSRESLEAFAWAHWVLQERSLHFSLPPGHAAGEMLSLIAPGLELLGPPLEASEEVISETLGACPGALLQLELGLKDGPAVVLYAGRDYDAGERIRLWHRGLACSQGFRLLMGLGRQLEVPQDSSQQISSANSWESVEVLLRLPVVAQDCSEDSSLWNMVSSLEAALQGSRPHAHLSPQPGDCLPPDNSWRRVEVVQQPHRDPEMSLPHAEQSAALEVHVRLPVCRNQVPRREALEQLGLLICANSGRMERVMQMEKDVINPLGPKACRKRALGCLSRRLQSALEEYPSRPAFDAKLLMQDYQKQLKSEQDAGSADSGEQLLPRRVRALLLVAAERQLLVEAAATVKKHLEELKDEMDDMAEQIYDATAEQTLGTGVVPLGLQIMSQASDLEPPSSSALGVAMKRLQGCGKAADNLNQRFGDLLNQGKFTEPEGEKLKCELCLLAHLLSSSAVGDVLAPNLALGKEVPDVMVVVELEARMGMMKAARACLRWQLAAQERRAKQAEGAAKQLEEQRLGELLLVLAASELRLGEVKAADVGLQRFLQSKLPALASESWWKIAFEASPMHMDMSTLTLPAVRCLTGSLRTASAPKSNLRIAPSLPGPAALALAMARRCAVNQVADSNKVLSPPEGWTSLGQILQSLYTKLKDLGYMKVYRKPWPGRLPPAQDLALAFDDIGFLRDAEKVGPDLKALQALFLLHEPLSLDSAAKLMGTELLELLLKLQAVLCFDSAKGCRLELSQAIAAAKSDQFSNLELIATVALWPAREDLLVAVDFDQVMPSENGGGEESVQYLARDSRALLAASAAAVASDVSGGSRRVLDLCCGCGAMGLSILRQKPEKWDGVQLTFLDDNPRALRFAEFSANLNGLTASCAFKGGAGLFSSTMASKFAAKQLQEASKEAGGEGFDYILANMTKLPNPAGAAFGGAAYQLCKATPSTGADVNPGLEFLAAVLKDGPEMLSPGGCLLGASYAPGPVVRLEAWLSASAAQARIHSTIFRGVATPMGSFARAATPHCSDLQQLAYERNLRWEGPGAGGPTETGVSEVVVMLYKAQDSKGKQEVALRSECSDLWNNEAYIGKEVSSTLSALRLSAGATPQEQSIYSLDWDDGENDDAADGKEIALVSRPRFLAGYPSEPDRQPKSRTRNLTSSSAASQKGATWEDLALEPVLGFSLPALCDVLWRAEPAIPKNYAAGTMKSGKPSYLKDGSETKEEMFVPVPKIYDRTPSPLQRARIVTGGAGSEQPGRLEDTPKPTQAAASSPEEEAPPEGAESWHMALLDLPLCAAPNLQMITALLGARIEDRIFLSDDGKLRLQKGYLLRLAAGASPGVDRAEEAKVQEFDVLLVPLAAFPASTSTPHALCAQLLNLLQAVVAGVMRTNSRPLRIVLLSFLSIGPGSSTFRNEAVNPQAPAVGLVRTLRAEVPQVPLLWLDTDADDGADLQAQLSYELDLALPSGGLANATAQEKAQVLMAHNRDVAYRQGRRWLPRLDLSPKMPVYAGRVAAPLPQPIAEHGFALVTGGVGGVGLAAAESLVELGVRRVILTSRSGVVPDGQSATQRIQAMESAGSRIIVEACDIAIESQVRGLLDRLRSAHGPLRVLVHATGLLEDRPFEQHDPESFAKVFEPKAQGAWHLHRHTLGDNLQAFVLCSSVAVLRGSAQQANYAAANAYLDELARLRAAHGLPAVSLQWPAIDSWSEEALAEGPERKAMASSIDLGVVRQVFKLMITGDQANCEPVQAILPGAYLAPTAPTVKTMLEPLLAKGLEKLKKKGQVVPGDAGDTAQGRGALISNGPLGLYLSIR